MQLSQQAGENIINSYYNYTSSLGMYLYVLKTIEIIPAFWCRGWIVKKKIATHLTPRIFVPDPYTYIPIQHLKNNIELSYFFFLKLTFLYTYKRMISFMIMHDFVI